MVRGRGASWSHEAEGSLLQLERWLGDKLGGRAAAHADAQLSFVRGADGKVTALVLHQNGMNPRAERVAE